MMMVDCGGVNVSVSLHWMIDRGVVAERRTMMMTVVICCQYWHWWWQKKKTMIDQWMMSCGASNSLWKSVFCIVV